MRVPKKVFFGAGLGLLFLFLFSPLGLAADPAAAGSGGYLAGYESADPRPSQVSWWSTLAYLVSLFAVFAFVVVLAYFASRFLSGRFGKAMTGQGGRVLEHLPLGPNRSVCVVEIAERVFMLVVTEHSITLLREITDTEEIERLHRRNIGQPSAAFDSGMFAQQFGSLEQLAKRIPSIFRNDSYRR